ncbi:U1 small nuclear ribonucleoprotein 70 kDa isoform X1 [Rhizophagus irregularis DAOM 181602=DAOM 197198]|nr:U1 small nuclear ribonucleoprotein 70 kDa isoform X1 [Rhizophagus irregularis DAOM 181602=DAOM 197198]
MTDKLPHNLLALFAPRPPLPYAKPLDRDPVKRKGPTVTGVGQYVPLLKDYDPEYVPTETVEEKKKRKLAEKKKKAEEAIKKGLEEWDPNKDENVTGDPFKTLFVARMSFDITEKDLRREFEMYGPIENIRIVKRKDDGKPRGYAFVEFEREKDMKAAYKDADGVKLLGRRILVDVERGRTVKGWRPRRLGGGLGGTRIGGPEQNQKYSGREGSYAIHTSHPPPVSSHDRDYRSHSRGGTSGGYGYSSSSNGSRYGSRHGGYGSSYDRDRDYRRRSGRSRSRSPGRYRDDRYGSKDYALIGNNLLLSFIFYFRKKFFIGLWLRTVSITPNLDKIMEMNHG